MQDIFGLDQRKSAARWQAAAFQLGGVMTVFGLLVMLMTAYKTFGAAELLGQILGALLLGSGLLAATGSKKRNSNCMTASLTISLLGRLLAFEFLTEVSREAGVDCALAELYTKSLAIERNIQEQKHAEVLTKLYVRMDEMEEMMSGVETGAVKSIQLSQAQEQLKRNDQDYVQSKMRHLKQHADGLLDTILNHPNMTEPQIHQMDAAQKEELQRRVQIADESLFERAIQTSMQPGLGGQHQWYPYSYMFGHLMRRAEFLVKEAAQLLGQEVALQQADTAIQSAMQSIGSRGGAVVLQQYRFMSTDEQLYKDLEGVLEQSCDMFRWRHQQIKQPITQTDQLTSLLEFWDGICHLYTGKAKPSHWVGHLLKTLKLFTAEARGHAASTAEIRSAIMTKANPLWAQLKAPRIKAMFETADIADANGNSSKRQKRSGTHRLDG